MIFSGWESKGTLDASLSLIKETLSKFQSNVDNVKNLMKQVFQVYLECVRLNQDIDNEKISHSVDVVNSLLNKWVEKTMGMKFGMSKSQWTGQHWSAFQAESEIKVILINFF